jgi:GTP-binding protein
MERRQDIRNVAIIAHVDHGKTTLVDAIFKQAGVFRDNQAVDDCVMDNNAQERERGITILAKNCAVDWKGVRYNIIDTPGHADFGGEVERVVRMADGCLLLVDAFEGPMPQTRFVLRKALQSGLKPILVVNKIDKVGGDPVAAVNKVFDLMVELGAEDWQLDFPVVYGSGRGGYMRRNLTDTDMDLKPLLDLIMAEIPGPPIKANEPLQMQVSNLDYNDFVGRIAIGRIFAGTLRAGQAVSVVKGPDAIPRRARILQVHRFSGLAREELTEAKAGDIVLLTGIDGVDISDTICDLEHPRALPPIPIDEPTIRMRFRVTDSPLSGQEGKPLQSRDLKGRIAKECERNVAMRLNDTERPDEYEVCGRGVLHLSVLIESMRREGSEFLVGPPRVILREEGGQRLEPIEQAIIEVPEDKASRVTALLLERRGELRGVMGHGERQQLEFSIPSRGLIGLRTLVLSATQGEAVMNTVFAEYAPWRGDIPRRRTGAIISMGSGEAVAFAIWNLQDRGRFLVVPNDPLYEGLIVGESNKEGDIIVNLTKAKHLTNIRSSGADEAIRLTPVSKPSLEEALEFIADDELVEITPQSIRIRKATLSENERKKQSRQQS